MTRWVRMHIPPQSERSGSPRILLRHTMEGENKQIAFQSDVQNKAPQPTRSRCVGTRVRIVICWQQERSMRWQLIATTKRCIACPTQAHRKPNRCSPRKLPTNRCKIVRSMRHPYLKTLSLHEYPRGCSHSCLSLLSEFIEMLMERSSPRTGFPLSAHAFPCSSVPLFRVLIWPLIFALTCPLSCRANLPTNLSY